MPWKEFQNNQTRRTHFGPKRPKRECQINMDNKESDEKKSKGRKQEKGSVHTVHLLAQRLRAKRRMAAWRPGDGKEEEEKVKTSFVCSSQSLFCRHIKRKSSAPWHFLTLPIAVCLSWKRRQLTTTFQSKDNKNKSNRIELGATELDSPNLVNNSIKRQRSYIK